MNQKLKAGIGAIVCCASLASGQTSSVSPVRNDARLPVTPVPSNATSRLRPPLNLAWTKQRLLSFAHLRAAQFVDAETGFVAGNRGALLRTTDGGASWHKLKLKTTDHIRDLSFQDRANGWLLCEQSDENYGSNRDTRSYVLRTTDAGETWRRTPVGEANTRLTRLKFITPETGFVTSEAGILYYTTNTGAKWTRLKLPINQIVVDLDFQTPSTLRALGIGGSLATSDDNGETWRESKIANPRILGADNLPLRYRALRFVDERRGWAVGTGGLVMHTADGGRTWTRQNSVTEENLNSILFLDARRGWLCGDNGTLRYTSDGGATWRPIANPTPHNLERLTLDRQNHLWALGFAGTLLKLAL